MNDDPKKPKPAVVPNGAIPLDDRWIMDGEEPGEILIIRDGEEIPLADLGEDEE